MAFAHGMRLRRPPSATQCRPRPVHARHTRSGMDVARSTGRRPRRLVEAFSSPDSYGLVLLLILVTYALSAAITAAWAMSLVLTVQIATVWVTLRASRARRLARVIANAILVISALAALVNLFVHQ